MRISTPSHAWLPLACGALWILSGVTGCDGVIGDVSDNPPHNGPPGTQPSDPRFEARVWRLTPAQVNAEVQRILGESAPRVDFPEGSAEYGITNISATARIDLGNASQFVESMRGVATWAAEQGAAAARCDDYGSAACVDDFLSWFPDSAFRRPVSAADRAELHSLFNALAQDYDYDFAFAGVIRAVLLSPEFLYRWELGLDAREGTVFELESYEIANLLAFSLTDRAPDDELLADAAAGQLAHPDAREAHARRLMDRSDEVWRRFFWEWLEMATLDSQGNEVGLSPELTVQMRGEYERFVSRVVVEERGNLADLLTSPQTWIEPELAAHYGASHPGDGVQPVTLDMTQRSGLLTQGAWLVSHGKRGRANVVRRGMGVFRDAMCHDISPLDIDLEAALADLVAEDATVREIVITRGEDETCGSCHRIADPAGLAFESFAGDGSWQTTYEADGNPVETDVSLPGVGPIDGAVDLSAALAQDADFQSCLVQRFAHFLMGHDVGSPAAVRWSREALSAFERSDGSFEELMVALVRDPAFIERRK